MKKFKFSLIIVLIAIGASAFTNIERVMKNGNRFAVTYYHYCTGIYVSAIPIGTCKSLATTACTITYTTSQGSSFPDTSIPSGGTTSSAKGCY